MCAPAGRERRRGAYHGYGPAYLDELEPRRAAGRMYLERARPLGALRYLWRAFRAWGPPGLFYLLWCKIAARVEALRRRSFLRFGPEPVQAVQRVPQYALFRQMASVPDALVRELATRVWARHRQDLIVEREDLEWLRRRCPGIRIVLSSASPRQVAQIASDALGIDEVIGSSVHRINGGRAKLDELRVRHPELLGVPGVITAQLASRGPSRRFRRLLEERLSVDLRLARRARPVSEVAFAMTRALERSREWLDRGAAA